MAGVHYKGPVTSVNGFVGAVTGNTTGDVTGNVTGNLTGNVTGNVTGNLTGNVTGNVTGNTSGATGAFTTSITVGSGTAVTKILRGTVAVDPASLDATTAADTTITITGAAAGDSVIMNPPTAGLTAGVFIVGAWVSAADTVKVRLYNSTGAPVDEASATWSYTLIRS